MHSCRAALAAGGIAEPVSDLADPIDNRRVAGLAAADYRRFELNKAAQAGQRGDNRRHVDGKKVITYPRAEPERKSDQRRHVSSISQPCRRPAASVGAGPRTRRFR
jgi:hypothetical protein